MASQLCRFSVQSAKSVFVQPKVLQVPVRCMCGPNPKIKAKQDHYSKEDDTPIYIKGGPMDQILYRTTMGLCLLGIGSFVYNIAQMAMPKNK